MNYEYLVARAQEPSTWRGLVMVLVSSGVTIAPELTPLIVSIGTGVAGLIGMAIKDD